MENTIIIVLLLVNMIIHGLISLSFYKERHVTNSVVAPKEHEQEIDESLGIIRIFTGIDKDLYEQTIEPICEEYDIIPAAALRHLIQRYYSMSWIIIEDNEDPEYPFDLELVLIKDDNQNGYLFGQYDSNKKEWKHVDDDNNYLPLPEGFIVSKWKILD